MKKIVLTFGLISGLIMSALMAANMALQPRIGFDKAMIVGYTTMIVAFLFIFFGVRAYRDRTPGGISFGRAFGTGVLITLVSSVLYVATWELGYSRFYPDFVEKYGAYQMQVERDKGASEAELAKKSAEIEKFAKLYKNPMYNAAFTFMEPFPVGVIMSLVAAGILRRRRKAGQPNQDVMTTAV